MCLALCKSMCPNLVKTREHTKYIKKLNQDTRLAFVFMIFAIIAMAVYAIAVFSLNPSPSPSQVQFAVCLMIFGFGTAIAYTVTRTIEKRAVQRFEEEQKKEPNPNTAVKV